MLRRGVLDTHWCPLLIAVRTTRKTELASSGKRKVLFCVTPTWCSEVRGGAEIFFSNFISLMNSRLLISLSVLFNYVKQITSSEVPQERFAECGVQQPLVLLIDATVWRQVSRWEESSR